MLGPIIPPFAAPGMLPGARAADAAAGAVHAGSRATRGTAQAGGRTAEPEPAVHLRLRVEDTGRVAHAAALHAALHAAHERPRAWGAHHPAGPRPGPIPVACPACCRGSPRGEPAAAGRGSLVVVLPVQHLTPSSAKHTAVQ